MFGRRPDGKRVKKLDPIIRMTPYLMPMRCDAQVFLEHKADYEKLSRYIAQKSREGEKITFMQVLAAAYVRAVSRNPEVNRFIFNKQFFARNNCSISYTVLKNPQDIHSNEDTVRILFDLTDGFHERGTLNVANGTTHLSDDEIQLLAFLVFTKHATLDLIGDMWHHLDGLSQVVAVTLTVNDRLVDASCCYRVVSCCVNASEALVVSEVQVCFHTVHSYVALTMLVGIQRTWVDVNVRVELLDGYLIAGCL